MTHLDPRPARPLTSREISKVIAGILFPVVTRNPESEVDALLQGLEQMILAFQASGLEGVGRLAVGAMTGEVEGPMASVDVNSPHFVYVSSVIGSLTSWCDPRDVLTAIRWWQGEMGKAARAEMRAQVPPPS